MESATAVSLVQIKKVAVIGAGILGWQLAARTAHAGFQVVLEDVLPSNLRRAESGMREHLMARLQSSNADDINAAMARVTFAATIADAVREADLALDTLPDELESKLEIFSMLDRMAPPHTIFCTPMQTLSIADLASCTYRADRCVAVRPSRHAGNAGDSVAATEAITLVYSHWTLPEVLQSVTEFWQRLGKSVHAEYDSSFA